MKRLRYIYVYIVALLVRVSRGIADSNFTQGSALLFELCYLIWVFLHIRKWGIYPHVCVIGTIFLLIGWTWRFCDRPKWPLLHWKTRTRPQALWKGIYIFSLHAVFLYKWWVDVCSLYHSPNLQYRATHMYIVLLIHTIYTQDKQLGGAFTSCVLHCMYM